jgi:hypothetical protein
MNVLKRLRKSGGKLLVLFSFTLAFQGIIGASSANASCFTSTQMETLVAGNGTYDTCGGDDIAYRIPISGAVVFGGVTYTSIYASTNSVISFGAPDANYYSFPTTPSISLDASDWVQDGYFGDGGVNAYAIGLIRDDEFFTITVSGEVFRVDIAARPYSTYSVGSTYNSDYSIATYVPQGTATRLILSFARQADNTLRILSFSSDATDPILRNGCVLSEGATAISLADCGILEVATIEEIVSDKPASYLVATSPLKVSQSKDLITCTSADLSYVVEGVKTQAPKLSSQTYSIKVEGKVVAEKSTLESSASFDKALLPSTGLATCSQLATQEGARVTVESEIASVTNAAAKLRKAEVAKILSEFKIQAQKLMAAKLVHLSANSSISYRTASEQWKAALLEAEIARDAAVDAAYVKEMMAAFDAGMMVNIGQ